MRREDATDLQLPNGLMVPAMLRTNELSLQQKKEHHESSGYGRLTHARAREIGYGEAEIRDALGPENASAPSLTSVDRDALRAGLAGVAAAVDALYAAAPALREHPGAVGAALDRMAWDRAAPAGGGV